MDGPWPAATVSTFKTYGKLFLFIYICIREILWLTAQFSTNDISTITHNTKITLNGRCTRLDKYWISTFALYLTYIFKLSTCAGEIRHLSLIAMSRGEYKLTYIKKGILILMRSLLWVLKFKCTWSEQVNIQNHSFWNINVSLHWCYVLLNTRSTSSSSDVTCNVMQTQIVTTFAQFS